MFVSPWDTISCKLKFYLNLFFILKQQGPLLRNKICGAQDLFYSVLSTLLALDLLNLI